ncbi:hypothetical protein ABE530_17360 [Brucella sp. TWI559]
MNFDPSSYSLLTDIASRALDVDQFESQRKADRKVLLYAYNKWKNKNQIEHVERDSLEWVQMMVATKREYEQFEAAKNDERNAKRRLQTAIKRYRQATLS